MSSQGILAYGYDLGGGAESWKVREAAENEFNVLQTPWYDGEAVLDDDRDDSEDTEDTGPFEAMIAVLYAAIPGARADRDPWDRQEAVEEHFDVTFVNHGDGYNFPQAKILAAYSESSEYGDTEAVDLTELQNRAVAEGWDERLARVLQVVELTPLADRPSWLLAAVENP